MSHLHGYTDTRRRILTSDSSTAVLGFLYLPLVLGTVVVVVYLLALLLHTLRSRHEHQSVAPSL